MRSALLILAVVAVANSYEFQEAIASKERSVSSQITDAIEAFRDQMPCGFPGLGLGPLAPARLTHKELNLGGEDLAVDGAIDDFIVYGLNDFEIEKFKINLVLSKVTFGFRWNHVYLDTDYQMGLTKSAGKPQVSMTRKGGAEMAFKDFKIWGTAKYSIRGNLRLKELKVYASLGEVKSAIENLSGNRFLNRKLNEIIEEWFMLAVNDNTDNLAELTNDKVMPLVNDMIGDRTLKDLLAIIGGGNGEEKPPKEPCVPPQTLQDLF